MKRLLSSSGSGSFLPLHLSSLRSHFHWTVVVVVVRGPERTVEGPTTTMLRRAPLSVGAGNRSWWWAGGVEAGACCTECLGSDSGDVGCDAAEIDRFFPPVVVSATNDADADVAAEEEEAAAAAEAEAEKRRRGGCCCFPPAMARATGALVLRAERRGGRLILTEVRADEHERRVVFRALRDAGRLRLRFANDDDDDNKPDEAGGDGGAGAGAGGGGVVPVAVQQHTGGGGGGGGGGGELCQVAAAGRMGGMEVGTVMMGTI